MPSKRSTRGSLLALGSALLLLAGCGGGGRTVTIGTGAHQSAQGWSARARDNFLNYCEAGAGGGHTSLCDCEADKVEAEAPSDAQLSELENDPAQKQRLVKLMIDASYACVP